MRRGARMVGAAAAVAIAARALARRLPGAAVEEPEGGRADRDATAPAVDRRMLSWSRETTTAPSPAPELSPADERAALATLRSISGEMAEEERSAVREALDAGAVSVRRLRPEDGLVWELPGRRYFDIEGVQTFGVEDPPGPA